MNTSLLSISILLVLLTPQLATAKSSPCEDSLKYLVDAYKDDINTQEAFDKIYAGLTDLPDGYSYEHSSKNPWKKAKSGEGLMKEMRSMFEKPPMSTYLSPVKFYFRRQKWHYIARNLKYNL